MMKTDFCFQVCFIATFMIFGNKVFCSPLHFNVQNRQTPSEEKLNLKTTTNPLNLNDMTPARNGVYHLFEPQLVTFLFRKLLTRTHDLKEHMKHVADKFVSNYFISENSSMTSKIHKAGKGSTNPAPLFTPASFKLGKKNHKRSVNKQNPHEEEIKKPFNFSPVVQFIPASLDLSNKIMFYQLQLIINGSVYIEQNKDSKPSQLQEMFNFNQNRNIVTKD